MSREGSFTITSSISYLRPSARSAQHSKLADSNYPAEIETPNPLGFEPPIETPMIRSMQSTRSCLPPRHCPARLPLIIPQFFLTGALESPHDLALRFCSNPINTSGTRCGITYLMKHESSMGRLAAIRCSILLGKRMLSADPLIFPLLLLDLMCPASLFSL